MSGQGQVFKSAIRNFLGPEVGALLDDESVSEILINGPHEIFVERDGKLSKTDVTFPDEDSLQAAVNSIAQSVGRRITKKEPALDARLPDGSRIHAVLPPCARNGTTVSIRKFTKNKMTLKDFANSGAISIDAAQFLDICMYLGKNVIVSGGTGSGKTTLLGVLANRIPQGQRVLVIEDSSELQIKYEHVVKFETQQADEQGQGKVSIQDLLRSALRLRPDRIIVGEVRGPEALELISAMNTGHKGCMGTVHANTPQDALVRLEGLAMGGDNQANGRVLQHQIGSSLNIVVQISRFSDGTRRIQSIAEVVGHSDQEGYLIHPIYELEELQKTKQGLVGELKPTGYIPTFMPEIEAHKIPFPQNKFAA